MSRRSARRAALAVLAVTAIAWRNELAPASDATQPTRASAIAQLGAEDPAIRHTAELAIADAWPASRAALHAAQADPDPQVRRQATQLLADLPLRQPADPPDVRAILSAGPNYNGFLVVSRLASLPDGRGDDALRRLVRYEPQSQIRLIALDRLRTIAIDRPAILVPVRQWNLADVDDDDEAALLIGFAWRQADEDDRALAAYARALRPGGTLAANRFPDVEQAAQWAIDAYRQRGRANDALALARSRLGLVPPVRTPLTTPDPVLDLFLLHATAGPLPGWAADVRNLSPYLLRPAALHVWAAGIDQRLRWARLARAIDAFATLAADGDTQAHLSAGDFLLRHNLNEAAERELLAVASLPSRARAQPFWAYQADMRLATLAEHRGDDPAAVVHLANALMAIEKQMNGVIVQPQRRRGGPDTVGPMDIVSGIKQRLAWHQLRAAGGGRTALRAALAVVAAGPLSPEMAEDVIPALDAAPEHRQQANALFDAAHDRLSARLADEPGNPTAQNDLAWLDASCDRHLSEAESLAQAALNTRPRAAALNDTLAMVRYRQRRFADAVKLEQHAATLNPGNPLIGKQLAKFQAAAAATAP